MKPNKEFRIVIMGIIMLLLYKDVVSAITITKKTVPSIPTKLSATNITASQITLKWSTAKYAKGYAIYRKKNKDSKYVKVGKSAKPTYIDKMLKPQSIYWYYIKAYNGTKSSKSTKSIKVITSKFVSTINGKQIIGFATNYYNNDISSYNSILKNSSSLNQIITTTFIANQGGNLNGTIPSNQLILAKQNKINTQLMISNNFSEKIAKSILENNIIRDKFITNIISSVVSNGYNGVNIDFEGVGAADRNQYSSFVKELYTKLHPLNIRLSLSVPAKTIDYPKNTWNGAFDYAYISKYADSIIIMAYDEHSPGSTPGPIASINWVRSVINYALTTIPKNKIILGIAAYGYDWSSLGTRGYSISGINNLIAKYKATLSWDTASRCPYFTYKDKDQIFHTVWFENSTSLVYKLDIVNSANLSGIAMWRLGLENEGFWTTIQSKLKPA